MNGERSATLATEAIPALLRTMGGLRVLVVGDVMIDEWVWGRVSRISPEAPVPVVAVERESFTLGGAGNVANNLRAIGARVGLAATIGEDVDGTRLLDLLETQDVDARAVVRLADRRTTRKLRVVAHNQQVVRADWESVAPLVPADRAHLVAILAEAGRGYDAIVLSDYAKGLFDRELVAALLERAPVVIADPKPANIDLFAGVTCVAPNASEAEAATGVAITDDASLAEAGAALLRRLGCRYVVITRGERGISLFGRDGERMDVPSVARTVYDVSGAGDTVVALLTLALAAGAPIETAVTVANIGAGIVVGKLGTAVAMPDEIAHFAHAPT